MDREKSNVENSENTTLFLVSCYEYILSGIVLSVGPPFRQSMAHNCKSSDIILRNNHGSSLHSTIRGDNCGSTPILLLYAIRPVRVGGEIHAINEDELGFQIICPGFRDRIYCFGLVIRELRFAETGEVLGQVEDYCYQKTKTA